MSKYLKKPLKYLLNQIKDITEIESNKKYKLITISNTGEIKERKTELGKNIKAKKLNKLHEGHFIYSRLAAHTGSYGLIPQELNLAVASNEMPCFEIDKTKILPAYFEFITRQKDFTNKLKLLTQGMGRVRIKEKQFLDVEIEYHSEITTQQSFLEYFISINQKVIKLSDLITAQSSYLTQLRQAILQEAIEGKLTADWRKENPVRKGDPDYDAEALLDKIKAEKDKLLKEGKIKKQKPLAPIKPEEVPFELPEGWVWTRVINYSKQYVDCPHDTPKYIESGFPCLRAPDVTESEVQLDNVRYVSEPEYIKRISRLRPEVNDIVYIREGGRLGIAGLIKTEDAVCLGQRVMLMKCFEKASSQFLSLFLNAPDTFKSMVGKTIGAASPHINVRDIIAHILPVPPLSEQKAIVDRVEKLLSMVDELEKQVSERQEHSEQLMQAVLREAFEGKDHV